MKALWQMLSGKKVRIGAILMIIAQGLQLIGQSEWSDLIKQIAVLLNETGVGLVGIGAVHYVIKEETK